MSDLISRQAVIDILNQKMREMPPERYADYYKGLMVANGVVQGLPSAQPEIIRCLDCKYYDEINQPYPQMYCRKHSIDTSDQDFCSHAERREDGTDR